MSRWTNICNLAYICCNRILSLLFTKIKYVEVCPGETYFHTQPSDETFWSSAGLFPREWGSYERETSVKLDFQTTVKATPKRGLGQEQLQNAIMLHALYYSSFRIITSIPHKTIPRSGQAEADYVTSQNGSRSWLSDYVGLDFCRMRADYKSGSRRPSLNHLHEHNGRCVNVTRCAGERLTSLRDMPYDQSYHIEWRTGSLYL